MTKTELLLVQLSEELSEVQHEIAKAIRFGLDDLNPVTYSTNREAIVRELIDVVAVIDCLYPQLRFSVDLKDTEDHKELYADKMRRVTEYLEYSKDRGVLDQSEDTTVSGGQI